MACLRRLAASRHGLLGAGGYFDGNTRGLGDDNDMAHERSCGDDDNHNAGSDNNGSLSSLRADLRQRTLCGAVEVLRRLR